MLYFSDLKFPRNLKFLAGLRQKKNLWSRSSSGRQLPEWFTGVKEWMKASSQPGVQISRSQGSCWGHISEAKKRESQTFVITGYWSGGSNSTARKCAMYLGISSCQHLLVVFLWVLSKATCLLLWSHLSIVRSNHWRKRNKMVDQVRIWGPWKQRLFTRAISFLFAPQDLGKYLETWRYFCLL